MINDVEHRRLQRFIHGKQNKVIHKEGTKATTFKRFKKRKNK